MTRPKKDRTKKSIPRRILGSTLRSGLEKFGYVLWKREFIRYGVSPFLDISRLNQAWGGGALQTFFDVGANIGQTTSQALQEFPEARVFAFEPHPETFHRLETECSSKRLSLHQLALGESSGKATFYEYGHSGDGTLINSLVPDARFPIQFGFQPRELSVECSTIDAFCKANMIESVDVLKIDTEGSELSVLKGARRMLQSGCIRFVYLEFNDLWPKTGTTGGALVPIADYLMRFGMRYVATYTDFVLPESDVFVCANVLFARPPRPLQKASSN